MYGISICSHEHTTSWHLMDLFAQGNVTPPRPPAPRLLKPPPCIIHIHRHGFRWHASPWTCSEDFCTGLCLRGIMGCGRMLFTLQWERKRGFGGGVQQQQQQQQQQLPWPMKGQLLDGFPRCVLGVRAQWWHLQTANKAVRQEQPACTQEPMKKTCKTRKMLYQIVFVSVSHAKPNHGFVETFS